jgi:AcrR family transcriptional regulator
VVRGVMEATLAELALTGYGALRIEDVAVRAGVNKTTVYRRWPTKEELVPGVEAMLLFSVLMPAIHHRLMEEREAVDEEFLGRLVDLLLYGAMPRPPVISKPAVKTGAKAPKPPAPPSPPSGPAGRSPARSSPRRPR